MSTATVNGLTVHYQTVDAAPAAAVGETVVFVHGLGTDSLASFHLTLASPVAAAGIDVVSYDLRGHGRTERPRSGYTLDAFVADLDALLDELARQGQHDRDRPVHLVGNSFGGTVAYSYAAHRPERVASIVSIEAEPPTLPWADRMASVLGATVEFLTDEQNYTWIETTYGAHHRRLARMAAERITSTTMSEEIPLGPLLDTAQVAEIACPVLSLLGSHGYQSDDLEALTGVLPSAQLHVFPDQGHSVLVERHREVRALVVDWVLSHRAGHGGAVSWRAS